MYLYSKEELLALLLDFLKLFLFYIAVERLGTFCLGERRREIRGRFPFFYAAAIGAMLLWSLLQPSVHLLPPEGDLRLTLTAVDRLLRMLLLPLWWLLLYFLPPGFSLLSFLRRRKEKRRPNTAAGAEEGQPPDAEASEADGAPL